MLVAFHTFLAGPRKFTSLLHHLDHLYLVMLSFLLTWTAG